eukprot:5466265-Pleurochrysis_carterae.AAC.1
MKVQPTASMRLRWLGDLAICSWGTRAGAAATASLGPPAYSPTRKAWRPAMQERLASHLCATASSVELRRVAVERLAPTTVKPL